ncbi:MAG: methyltransferase [Gammaproteobacteria bacterium]
MSLIRLTSPLLAALCLTLGAAPAAADHHDPVGDAVAGQHRSEANRARDQWRHPEQTLAFFGFRPDFTVIEIFPGGGWYTEILAPALRDSGRLVAAHYGENTSSDYRNQSHRDYVAKLAAEPKVYDQVNVIAYDPATSSLGEPGRADMVLTFRGLHGMQRDGTLDSFLADAYEALKPGGVLGVVQHRAPEGVALADASAGYLPQPFVIERARAAGFELAGTSEINANPKDTADYAKGVWTLPPVLRLGEEDREKYLAIGESDRMTLKFIKPAS